MTTVTISAGNTSSGGTVAGNDDLVVYGSAIAWTVSGFEQVYSGGSATSTTVSGGFQQISGGGSATDTTILTGFQEIFNGGSAADTAVLSGFQEIFNGGSVTDTTVLSGAQNVFSGGSATDTTVLNGDQEISSGGSATSTTVSGGFQVIDSGGSATDTTILGDFQEILSGGSVTSTTIVDGRELVESGGSATTTTISGGYQMVYGGGTVTSTTVNGGNLLTLGTDGVGQDLFGSAFGTTLNSSGIQVVESGGSATSTTVNGGGQVVSAGGTATSTTISGGMMEVQAGAIVSGAIAFGGVGTLKVDQGVSLNTTSAFGNTLSGLQVGDTIDLAGLAFVLGATTAVVVGSTLTVTAGTSAETFILANPASTAFAVTQDASGGTKIVNGYSNPVLSDTIGGQVTTSEATVHPFAQARLTDNNPGVTDTLTISLSGLGGTLSGSGLSASGGSYTLSGSQGTITTELEALVFTPAASGPDTSATTRFTLNDASSTGFSAAPDSTTTVTNTDPALPTPPAPTPPAPPPPPAPSPLVLPAPAPSLAHATEPISPGPAENGFANYLGGQSIFPGPAPFQTMVDLIAEVPHLYAQAAYRESQDPLLQAVVADPSVTGSAKQAEIGNAIWQLGQTLMNEGDASPLVTAAAIGAGALDLLRNGGVFGPGVVFPNLENSTIAIFHAERTSRHG